MPVQIQLRRGTSFAWTAANPILANGEVGIETDTHKEKVGNGSTAWTSLPYRAATSIAFTPAGNITATTVQTAIEEVAVEAGVHPDLAAHDALGLATDAELASGAATAAAALASGVSTAEGYADTKDAAHAAAADPHTGYQKESEKGAVSGYAALDTGGKVPSAQLPSIAFGQVFTVSSEAAMLALSTAVVGDIAIRDDVSQTFILSTLPPATLGNWHELLTPAGGVSSVNTRTGAVTGVQDISAKGSANGYAGLDSSGYVPDTQLNPTIARDTEIATSIITHETAGDPHPTYETAAEAQALVDTHTADTSAAHAAAAVAFTPTGTVAATDVQAAIAEVAAEAGAGAGLVPTTARKRYVMPSASGGSDAFDGRSWSTAYASVAAAITALGGSSGQGDIYLGPGTHAWTDTIILGQGVRLHGVSPHGAASGGTEMVWTGVDDGRDGLVTSANSSADWTQGVIENIRFTGSGAGMTGGGTALHIRNAQNSAKLFNVRVVGWGTGTGIKVDSTINTGFPGYANFENVWVSGSKTGWDIQCPMTNLVFTNCASDPVSTHGTLRSWLIRAAGYPYGAAVNKTITSSSSSGSVATHVCTGHGLSVGYFVDISGTSVSGYHGVFYVASVPDANTFTVNTGAVTALSAATGGTAFRAVNGDRGTLTFVSCKSESNMANAGWQFRGSSGVVLIGCTYFEQTGNAAGIAFNYLGPIHNAWGEVDPAPRMELIDCVSQNMEYSFVAPFHGVSILAENGYASGRFQHINYTGRSTVSLTDLPAIAAPKNPRTGTRRLFTDIATGQVSVRTSAGTTVALEPAASSSQYSAYAKPAVAVRENFTRLGANLAAQNMLVSGRLSYIGIPLLAGDIVSAITFFSHTQAGASLTNQWFCLMDPTRHILAKTVNDLTTAWAAPARKTLAVATDKDDASISSYTIPAEGMYLIGICVVATTVPYLAGVNGLSIISDEDPNSSASADTGLTTPVSCPDIPAVGTATGFQPYCYVS